MWICCLSSSFARQDQAAAARPKQDPESALRGGWSTGEDGGHVNDGPARSMWGCGYTTTLAPRRGAATCAPLPHHRGPYSGARTRGQDPAAAARPPHSMCAQQRTDGRRAGYNCTDAGLANVNSLGEHHLCPPAWPLPAPTCPHLPHQFDRLHMAVLHTAHTDIPRAPLDLPLPAPSDKPHLWRVRQAADTVLHTARTRQRLGEAPAAAATHQAITHQYNRQCW